MEPGTAKITGTTHHALAHLARLRRSLWVAQPLACLPLRTSSSERAGGRGRPWDSGAAGPHACPRQFVEYTPFVLILMALLEYAGGSAEVLGGAGVVYLFARVFHAVGSEPPGSRTNLLAG